MYERIKKFLTSRCASCKMHAYADSKPDSIISRLWRWHTSWCPVWKMYQRALAAEEKTSEQQAGTDDKT